MRTNKTITEKKLLCSVETQQQAFLNPQMAAEQLDFRDRRPGSKNVLFLNAVPPFYLWYYILKKKKKKK